MPEIDPCVSAGLNVFDRAVRLLTPPGEGCSGIQTLAWVRSETTSQKVLLEGAGRKAGLKAQGTWRQVNQCPPPKCTTRPSPPGPVHVP